MEHKVKDHLERLVKYLNSLKELSTLSREEFSLDSLNQAACERYFQLSIESCINIGNIILSHEQFKTSINAPETYADIFRGLEKLRIIGPVFLDELIKMTKFRNRLDHIYWDIDKNHIYDILQTKLWCFETFIHKIIEFYNSKANFKEKSKKKKVKLETSRPL